MLKIYLYTICTMASAFALSSINFEKFLKKNKVFEARLLYFILSFICGYLLADFLLIFVTEGL